MDMHTNSAEELYALYHKDIVRFFAEILLIEKLPGLCHEVFVAYPAHYARGGHTTSTSRHWLLRPRIC